VLRERGNEGHAVILLSEHGIGASPGIVIIEAHDASQYGIGIVSVRITENSAARRARGNPYRRIGS
jgi:hypothetical protein